WERGGVGVDQRLDRLEVEAAHEHEGKVAGVGETGLVESQRGLQIPLVDAGRRLGLSPRVVPPECRVDRAAACVVCAKTTPGLESWFATSAFASSLIAAKDAGSARGCVKRRWSSWNIVSRSCGVLPPRMPWLISPMNGATATALADSSLSSVTWLNWPTPPAGTIAPATRADGKSASLASDVPPEAKARNRIWSSFNFVGLSTMVAPLDSVHSVMPASRRGVVRTIVPRAGGDGISACSATTSTYGWYCPVSAARTAAASCACSGRAAFADSGADTMISRVRYAKQT